MTDSKKKPAAIRYGFIGLGHLGGLLARSLIRGGFAVAVHDLDREAADPLLALGASWAESPAEAAAVSDAVITCLPSPFRLRLCGDGTQGRAQRPRQAAGPGSR